MNLTKKDLKVREVEADASEDAEFTFKLPRTRIPEPVMEGVRGWKTKDHYLVLRIHYTADPEADLNWKEERVKGYRGGFEGSDWQREMEIDFGSYAGKPVYPQFTPSKAVRPLSYNPHIPLWRGWDFGYRNPAVTFYQLWPDDTLVYLHEIFPTIDKESTPGISTGDLAQLVIAETEKFFPSSSDTNKTAGVFDFCDPSGTQKKETSDLSSVEILRQYGIDPEWSSVGRKNRIIYARIYVEGTHEDGKPKFLINPHCTLGIEAFKSAYRYPEDKGGSMDREMPDLSKKIQSEPFIHIMDSFEYVVACNLEVTSPSMFGHRGPPEEDKTVADLASIYLGASEREQDRVASIPLGKAADMSDLDTQLSELIGVDDLADAWSVV